ncbi:MAG TPA: hypothetical protein VHF25_02260, partial [Nitriliruptorales bacterium]|nr:hypothetical protein [Nitriliruptorales bacterium]
PPGLPVRATHGNQLSGDEPHYLVTAVSLEEDLDLDVSDEMAAERYRAFHAQGLRSQAARQPSGRMVVPHDPLLPAVLALPVRLAGWVGAKLTLAAVNGVLAGLLVWVAVRRLAVPRGTAALTAALFGASAPLAVYGHQVYPELPAGLAVAVAVAVLTGALRPGGLVAFVVAVVALPWLSVKYVGVAAAITVLGFLRLLRRGRRRTAVVVAGVLLAAGLVHVVAHLTWYGGLTVYAAGEFFAEHGGQLSVTGTAPQLWGRARRLVGLLVDRQFGLAAWQPAWLLAVPALAGLARRRPDRALTLGLPLATGWLTATFLALTMQGWWFPGRQVVVVLPAAAVAVAWWTGGDRRRVALLAITGSVGVASYGHLVAEGLGRELTWVVDFAATSNPWYRTWRWALPNYLEVTWATWALHVAWSAVAVVLVGWGWRGARYGVGAPVAPPAVARSSGSRASGTFWNVSPPE